MKNEGFLFEGNRSRIIFMAVIICIFSAVQVHSQNWSNLSGGMNGWVYATTVYNGNLIAGGSFSSAGGVAASNIAEWNGSAWMPLGTGVNGQVDALIEYNNELIVGGRFTNAGGVEVLFLAKWNGIEWSDVNGDMGNIVVSLAVYQNNLIVGGYFRDADGFPANYVVGFNGEWFNLGVGMGGSQGQVMALTVHNNELYAGGFFTSAGGSPAAHIAKWNGTSWSPLGTGISNIVYSLASYGGDLIAGGLFLSAGGVSANHIAKWNGTTWSPLGSGMAGTFYQYVFGLDVYQGDLIAGGLFTHSGGVQTNGIARWNGSSWSGMAGGFFNGGANACGAYTVTTYGAGVVAGGLFTTAGSTGCGNIAMYYEPQPGTINITAMPEGFYDPVTNTLRQTDEFTLYLYGAGSPYPLYESSTAFIDSVTHTGTFTFSFSPSGQYYIGLGHRNSIETWSTNPVNYVGGGSISYDFTNSQSQAYGNNMKQVDSSPVEFGIYSGDVNQDWVVDGTDAGLIDNDAYNFVSGYVDTDLTGDYTVDASDAALADNNAANFVGAITP